MRFKKTETRSIQRGFTLIEMSIVLVIIGLIVGGILVGQNLLDAAAVRAQIAQIEKYQTAVNTFRGKYGALPGDLNQAVASQFGFVARGTDCSGGPCMGEGDGNGLIEGNINNNGAYPLTQFRGETALFWVDLSAAGLIEGAFTAGSCCAPTPSVLETQMGLYFPPAKIGNGSYIHVWSGGWTRANAISTSPGVLPYPTDGLNYFGVTANPSGSSGGGLEGSPSFTVSQAYNIDKKIDDGLPQTGKATVFYFGSATTPFWSFGYAGCGAHCNWGPTYTNPTTPSSLTCMDNNNINGVALTYSMSQNNGAGLNCGMSFQFQ
jgi:prepilin-type N-terminal cleavage/methylation domain-containing protein